MFLIWGLLKAVFTDLTGGYRQRRFKDPTETPIWELGKEIRSYTALVKMSQDEMSEEQRQALLNDDEGAREANSTLHSFPPSKDELAKLRPGQEDDEELVQKGYEEVVEDDDNSEVDTSDDSDLPELPPAPELSLGWEDSEPEEAT